MFVSFVLDMWCWCCYVMSGLFDNDKFIKDYSVVEYDLLMYVL